MSSSSIQSGPTSAPSTPTVAAHRLKLKQTPIDTWSLKEQLGLASAVLRSGDQNWVSVSRQMKPFSEEHRPSDWFSQKNCALQYNKLLEQVDTPRRRRGSDRSSSGVGLEAVETPGESIVKRLTTDRIKEIKDILIKDGEEIERLEKEVELLANEDMELTDEQLDEIQARIDEEERIEAEKKAAREQWLAEREQKKQAIQAALKMHSSKVPLKGAAAAAQLAGAARRASIQSEASSGMSDVDSPAPPPKAAPVFTKEPEKEESVESTPVTTPVKSNAETTSPLLSSLLKSPAANASHQPSFVIPESKEVMEEKKKQEEPEEEPREEEVKEKEEEKEEEKVEPSTEESTEPIVVDSKPEETEVEEEPQETPEAPTPIKPVEEETVIVKESAPKEEEEDELMKRPTRPADGKQVTPIPTSATSGRSSRSKKANETGEEDVELEDTAARTPSLSTRSSRRVKRTSERSNEDATQDDNSNDSAFSFGTKATPRGLRSQRKTTVSGAGDDQKEEPTTVPENKRLIRLRESDKEYRSRKSASGTSRSNSPLGTGDESDSEPKRPTRHRRNTGRSQQADAVESNPPSPSGSVASSVDDDKAPQLTEKVAEWKRKAVTVLEDLFSHKLAETFEDYSKFPSDYKDVVLQPMDLNRLQSDLDNGNIKTTIEFQRNATLMFLNSLMYHQSSSENYSATLNLYMDFDSALGHEKKKTSRASKGRKSGGGNSSKRRGTPLVEDRGRKRAHDDTPTQSSAKKRKR